ncbi:MAG TPA: MAPEG family protein [Steroidobacteraceae bacterium]|nr:MAPEG family protein [Steroidobacteraceae bacterium]HQR47857.1 MAPEG family protein [Steroidobacteraceae bacterium]
MPTNAQFLMPVLALVAWTFVMWAWMYATRIPAMRAAGIDPQDAAYSDALGERLPPQVRWKADNYNHLHEQPTIFYALMFFAALTGGGDAIALELAWAYVALRVVHSLVQATVNRIVVRFALFMLASLVLLAFTVREAMRLL